MRECEPLNFGQRVKAVEVRTFPETMLEGTNVFFAKTADRGDIDIEGGRLVLTDIAQREEIAKLRQGGSVECFHGGVKDLPIDFEIVRQRITISVSHGSDESGSAGTLKDKRLDVLIGP